MELKLKDSGVKFVERRFTHNVITWLSVLFLFFFNEL